MKSFKNKRK